MRAYLAGLGKEAVQKEFKKQTDIFVKNDVDFLIGEVKICRSLRKQPSFFALGPSGVSREGRPRYAVDVLFRD